MTVGKQKRAPQYPSKLLVFSALLRSHHFGSGSKVGPKNEGPRHPELCSQGTAVFLLQQNPGGLFPRETRTVFFLTGGLRAQLRAELATTLKTEGLNEMFTNWLLRYHQPPPAS